MSSAASAADPGATGSRLLVIGLSGQVGAAVARRLRDRRQPILALSRQSRPRADGVEWLTGSLEAMPVLTAPMHGVLSLGPLDAFADWFEAQPPAVSRVVALSSTGRNDKLHSPDPAERALAERLRSAEARLFAAGLRHGIAVTVLRPTLLYGSGRDRSLTRLVDFARRWHFLPLPSSATGRRQPVHVDDVADAVLRCLDAPVTAGRAYDLPGGEVLDFQTMVRRTLARQAPKSRVLLLPAAWCRLGLALLGKLGSRPPGQGALARLENDQLADAAEAARDFGYAPRRFDP